MAQRKKSAEIHALFDHKVKNVETRDLKVDPILPSQPNWLSRRGRAVWDSLLPELGKNALCTKRDKFSFALMCEDAAIAVECLLALRSESNGYGSSLLDVDASHQNRVRLNPLWRAYKDASASYHLRAKEFGLTPTARIGLMVDAPTGPVAVGFDDDEDLFA